MALIAAISVASLLGTAPTQAMQGGEDATGDNLVNAVYVGSNPQVPTARFLPRGCSASLIHPRIVVTAAHCHSEMNTVSAPGQDLRPQIGGAKLPGQSLVVSEVAPSQRWGSCQLIDSSCYDFDIKFLVLDSPQPFNNAVRMATMNEINEWVANKSPGVIYGYGTTYRPFKSTWYPVRTHGDTIMVETRTPNVTNCPGDSGGPLYFQKGSEILYVGPHFTKRHDRSGDSSVTRPCGFFADGTSPWSTHVIAALYPELMEKALAKVTELEAAEAKVKEAEAQKAKVEAAKKPKKKGKKVKP